jgi:hypothetical protein
MIDRIVAGSELRLGDRRVSLAGSMLDALTERTRAEARFELCQGETVLAESRHAIVALARNEWGGAQFMPELLAAFITPNDPAISRLLKEASRILETSAKVVRLKLSSSVSQAQLGDGLRHLGSGFAPRSHVCRAARKLRAAGPEDPSALNDRGAGTCDLPRHRAALRGRHRAGRALSGRGLNKGHALAGVWLQPQTLPSLTVEDPMEIRKAVAQEELVLFETTMATGGRYYPFRARSPKAIGRSPRRMRTPSSTRWTSGKREVATFSRSRTSPNPSSARLRASPLPAMPSRRSTMRPSCRLSTPTLRLSRRGHRPRPSGSIAGSGACSISQSTTGCLISNRQQPRFRSSVLTRRCSRTKSPKTRRSP